VSYDLDLYPRKKKRPLRREAFLAYFEGERFHHDGDTVNYSNDDTGVYFHFTWYGGGTDVDAPNRQTDAYRRQPYIHFNMNYFRPHTFGLEAARVLPRVVEHFDLVVSDPQSEGMGQGDFSEEGFLRGWNAGNRFAAQAVGAMRQAGETALGGTLTLPAALNRAYWDWNYRRQQICDDLCDLELIGVYVPPIWFCREDGQVRSFALFPNLVPTAVPRVDYVFALRNELGKPYAKRSKDTPAWVRWEELVAAAPGFEVRGAERGDQTHPHLILFSEDYHSMETPPKSLANWVIGLPGWPGKPDQVRPDEILDAELLASL
jgi:hypothetical protein